ncbi:TlpA disulfide reductase family protein [Paenibacillus sp. LHD-117]|uniref:TlpA disulfide reductase family protein n=1 Tax=Paenibacillus sp. LHD-117 TaxID=3071412 RepID=UPI0027E1CBA7|nr:TlpA disulfide reductase family protein [Paenibacillus sp. LHD-117]MDQ6423526.1 TlpA disulfide reductase family protein [Paenibacillus sp. LHD-117]
MNKPLLLGGAALLLLLIAGYFTNQYGADGAEAKPTVVQTREANGEERITDFTLNDLSGNPVSLSDYEGKVVYVNFWATWCKWCKKEMPDMEKIHQAYKDKDLVILAISVGEEQGKVADYIREHGYTFQVLTDPEKTVAEAYRVRPIPVSVFLDRDGRISHQKLGYMTEDEMKVQIDPLLAADAT